MREIEEIRLKALEASLRYYWSSLVENPAARVMRTQIIETAARFEEYIVTGK